MDRQPWRFYLGLALLFLSGLNFAWLLSLKLPFPWGLLLLVMGALLPLGAVLIIVAGIMDMGLIFFGGRALPPFFMFWSRERREQWNKEQLTKAWDRETYLAKSLEDILQLPEAQHDLEVCEQRLLQARRALNDHRFAYRRLRQLEDMLRAG